MTTPDWLKPGAVFGPGRKFVPMKEGDKKSPFDNAPEGFREENDAEFRARLQEEMKAARSDKSE